MRREVASKMVPWAHYFFCHRPPTYSMVTIYWPKEAFKIDKWTPLPLLKVYTSAVLLLTYNSTQMILSYMQISFHILCVHNFYMSSAAKILYKWYYPYPYSCHDFEKWLIKAGSFTLDRMWYGLWWTCSRVSWHGFHIIKHLNILI